MFVLVQTYRLVFCCENKTNLEQTPAISNHSFLKQHVSLKTYCYRMICYFLPRNSHFLEQKRIPLDTTVTAIHYRLFGGIVHVVATFWAQIYAENAGKTLLSSEEYRQLGRPQLSLTSFFCESSCLECSKWRKSTATTNTEVCNEISNPTFVT